MERNFFFDKDEFKREQYRYKKHYINYFLGKLYDHPEFNVGRYLYHLRLSEKYYERRGG